MKTYVTLIRSNVDVLPADLKIKLLIELRLNQLKFNYYLLLKAGNYHELPPKNCNPVSPRN